MAEDVVTEDVDTEDQPQPVSAVPPRTGPDWRAGLPAELAGHKTLAKFTDVPALAKSYVELEQMAGGAVKLPNEKATPEQRQKALDEVYAKLGWPREIQGYGVERPPLPEGANWDDALEAEMLGAMHQARLTKGQAQAVFDAYARITETAVAGQAKARQQEMASSAKALQQEWGPNYKRNLSLVHRAVQSLGDESFWNALESTGLGNHPALVKAFLAYAEQLAEDGTIVGDHHGLDAAGADERIKAMLNDKSHPFNNPRHPEHQAAVEEFHALHRIKLGSANRTVLTVR